MARTSAAAAVFLVIVPTLPAFAQEADSARVTVSGSAAITSDYRFRGISQTDKHMAVQGGLTAAHENGGYVGVWASNLARWGTFGGANMELDLIAGYKLPLAAGAVLDVGLTWYLYPGGSDKSDFAEPYVKVSGMAGPATVLVGIAYAPRQEALGRWYFSGADAAAGIYNAPGAKDDNLYLWGDAAVALAGAPFTAKGHIGYSDGNPGLGPNATSLAPTGQYWDWSLGVDATWRNLTLGVSYVDTGISRGAAAYLQPSFSEGQDGTGPIADGAVLVALTGTF